MNRANPLSDLNLDDFQTKAPDETQSKPDRKAIAKVAEENGFPSRQASAPKASADRPRQHYFRTGRNVQINVKGSPECDEHLKRLVAELDVPKGIILEEAFKALEAIKYSANLQDQLDREFPNRRKPG
jgi:hypothetical protein